MFLEVDGNTVHTNFYEPISKKVFFIKYHFLEFTKNDINFLRLSGTKYSRMDQVQFVEDSL